jgi:tetratricopeptide (TPR) repeat protein
MRSRFIITLLLLGSVALAAWLIMLGVRKKTDTARDQRKEKQEQTATAAKGGLPADQEAFYSTYRFTDPEERLRALEKFLLDFPNSSEISSARREIFKIIVKKSPGDKKKVLDAANKLVQRPAESGDKNGNNVPDYQFIARELFAAGIFLEEAERFASKSIEDFNKGQFNEGMKKTYAGWKKPLPSDEVINKKFRAELAAYRATLGRIYLKQGKPAEGERILREAFAVDPLLSQAAIGLAEIEERKGSNMEALDYLTTAALTAGHNMEDARGRLETIYRKTHSGSLDGLEALLDTRYEKLFPNPIKVERYKPVPSRSDRVVLSEFFTGAG